MKLILSIQNQDNLTVQLKRGNKHLDREDLTISRNLDTLLIRAIDKILSRNKIGRLSLKSLEIPAKLKDEAISNMILKTIKVGLGV